MKKTVVLLMVLSIVTNIISFLKEIVFSYYFGVSNISDAYLISLTIPSVIFGFVSIGISTGYIPIYNQVEREEGVESANKYTNNLINTIIGLCTILIIFGIAFAIPLVKIFASGFDNDTVLLAVKFTRIGFLGIYFTGIIYIYNSFLQIKGNFAVPSLGNLPLTLVTLLSIVVSAKFSVTILAVGSILGVMAQFLFLLPFVYREGYQYKAILNPKDEHMKKMILIALPLIVGVAADQINVLADRTVASQVAVGGITVLTYANKLIVFIQTIFIYSVTTAMYPTISRIAAENNLEKLKKIVSEVIGIVNLLIVPAMIGIMTFSQPIIKLLFGRGKFDDIALTMTAAALFFYAVGLVGLGIRDVLMRTFFSLQDTRTPAIVALASVTINVVLNLTFSRFMGISGLALATGIAETIGMLILFAKLRRRLGRLGIKKIVISFCKISIASLIMGVISKGIFNLTILYLGESVSLIISIVMGVIVYFIFVTLFKVDEVSEILKIIKKKLSIE